MVEKLFLLPLIVSAFLAYAITPLVIKIAWKYGLVDDPKKNFHPKKIHKTPIPRAGGLSIIFALLVASFIFLPFDKHLLGIITGAVFLAMIGILDDKYVIHPIIRLFLQFVGASFPIMAGIGIAFITNPLAGGVIDLSTPRLEFQLFGDSKSIWILSDLFAMFWLVALMNVLNMGAKGIEGQLPGVATIAALTVGIMSLEFSADIAEWPVIILASITAGSFLGFLPFNIHPQKIMPAFSGSMLAGYMLGILSILTTAKVGVLMVVLAIPMIDVGYAVIRRILQKKAPFWGDRGHLHHKLLDNGLSTMQVAMIYWFFTALLGLISFHLDTTSKLYTIIVLILVLGGLFLWLTYRKTK